MNPRRPATSRRVPIQPAGWVVLAVGLASLAGALTLNWRELLVLAVGCGAILLVSLAFVIGRSEIRLERVLASDRVTVGDDAVVELHALNTGSVRTTRQVVSEALDGAPVLVPLPGLAPGTARVVTWRPPTDRRGRFVLGPARIAKSDPCRLMQREVGQTGRDELWVQPRVAHVDAMLGGLTRDIDGPTRDDSPAGDVAFHAVRPYRVGDDSRHVHWMATARAGEMMVRHYVDNRQPFVSVLLDTAHDSWASAAEFDTGVDITASIGVSALRDGQPGSVRAGNQVLLGANRRSTDQLLLDDLTVVERGFDFDVASSLGTLPALERNTTVVVVVTGSGATAARLRTPLSHVGRTHPVVLVQVSASSEHGLETLASRSVRYVHASTLEAFVDAQRLVLR